MKFSFFLKTVNYMSLKFNAGFANSLLIPNNAIKFNPFTTVSPLRLYYICEILQQRSTRF